MNAKERERVQVKKKPPWGKGKRGNENDTQVGHDLDLH